MAGIAIDFNLDVAAEVEVDGSGSNTSTSCDTTHGLNTVKIGNYSKETKTDETDQLPKFSRLLPSRPTRPQMLGNLTFREIAGRRKTKSQPTRIKHEGLDVLNTSLSYLLLDSSECINVEANKQKEKLDLREFVGKTITLGPQNVSLKFVSNDSQSLPKSNGELLKINPDILFGKKDGSNKFQEKHLLNEKNNTSSFSNIMKPYECDIEIENTNKRLECKEKSSVHCNPAREFENNQNIDKPSNSVSRTFTFLQQSVLSQMPKQTMSTKLTNSCENDKIDTVPNNLSLLSEVASNQLVTYNSDVNKYTKSKRKYSPKKEVQGNCSPRLLRKDSVLSKSTSPVVHSNFVKTCKNLNFSNIEESKYLNKDQPMVRKQNYINRLQETKNTTHVKYTNKNTPDQEIRLNSSMDNTNNEITVLKEVYITTPKNSIFPHRANRLSTYKQSTENTNNRKTVTPTIKTEFSSQKGKTSFFKGSWESYKSKSIDLTMSDSSVIDQSYKKYAKSNPIKPNSCLNGKSKTTTISKKTKFSPKKGHPYKCYQDSYETKTVEQTSGTSSVRDDIASAKNHSIQDSHSISTSPISIPPTKPCFVLLRRIDDEANDIEFGVSSNQKLTCCNLSSPRKAIDIHTTNKFKNISPLNRKEKNPKCLVVGEQFNTAEVFNVSDKSLGDLKSQLIPESMEPAAILTIQDENYTDQSSKEIFINYLQLIDVSSDKQTIKAEQVNAKLGKLRSYKSYIDNAKATDNAKTYLKNKTEATKDKINARLKTEQTKLNSPSKPIPIKPIESNKAVLKRNLETMNSQSNELTKSVNFSQTCMKPKKLFKPKKNKIIITNNKINDITIKTLELSEEMQVIEHSKTNLKEAISPRKTNDKKFDECSTLNENVICMNNEQKSSLNNVSSTLDLTRPHIEKSKEDNENLEIIDLTRNDESKNVSSPEDLAETNSECVDSRKQIHKLLDPSNKQKLRSFKPNSLNVGSCNIKSPSKKLSKNRQKWLKIKYLNNLEYYKSNPNIVVNQFHEHISSNMSPKAPSESSIQSIDSNHSSNVDNKKTNVEDKAKNKFKGRKLIDRSKDNDKHFEFITKNKLKGRTLINKNKDNNLSAAVRCIKGAMGNRIIRRKNVHKHSRLYRGKTCNKQPQKLNSTTNSCNNSSKSPLKVISKVDTETENKMGKGINRTSTKQKHLKCIKKKPNITGRPIVKPVIPSKQMVNPSPIDVVVVDDDDICEVPTDILSSKQKNNVESIKQIESTMSNNDNELTEIVYSLPPCRNESSNALSNNPLQNINNSSPQMISQGNYNLFPWQYPMVVQHTSQNNILCSNFGFPYMFSPYQAQACEWTGHQMSYNLGALSSLPQPIAPIPTENNICNTSTNVDSNINVVNEDLVTCTSKTIDDKSETVNETINNVAKQKKDECAHDTKSKRLRTTNKKRIQPYYFRKKGYSRLKRRKLSFSQYSSPTSNTKNIHCHNADNIIQEPLSHQLNTESNRDVNDSSSLNSNLKQTEEETSLTPQYSAKVYIRDDENIYDKDMCLGDNTLQFESSGLSVGTDSFSSETQNTPAKSICDIKVKFCTENVLNKVSVLNKKQMKILNKLVSEKLCHKIEFLNKAPL